MKTKRIDKLLAILLTLAMVVGMFPVTAFAAGETAGTHSSHDGMTAVTMGTSYIKVGETEQASNTLPAGSYYLGNSFTLSGNLTIDGEVTLCLNGQTLNCESGYIKVPSGATLNICDCSEGQAGKVTGTAFSYGTIYNFSGTVNLYSGTVENTYSSGKGIYNHNGTLNMSGGTVVGGNYGIYNYSGTATVSGGSVSGNYALYNDTATTYLSGTPSLNGTSADIYRDSLGTSYPLYANNGDGSNPSYYSGAAVTVKCDGTRNSAVIYGVSPDYSDESPLFTLTNSNYYLKKNADNDLILHGKDVSLTWKNGNETLTGDNYPSTVEYSQSVSFPTLSEDGKIFLGWSDGSSLYGGSATTVYAATTFTAVWADALSGDGSQELPYEITSAADLQNLAVIVNSGSSKYNKNSVYYRLASDIDLSTVCGSDLGSWTPIGGNNGSFKANFDGNGKTISNLYINKRSSYQGLFGRLNTGNEVKNLKVTGSVYASDFFSPLGYNYGGDTDANKNDTSGVMTGPYGYDCNGIMAHGTVDSDNTIDVKGFYNGSWVQTTFGDNGYDAGADLDGATVTGDADFINGGRYVKLSYTVTAGESPVSGGKLNVTADTMIGENDKATIEVIKDGNTVIGLKMADNDSSSKTYGAQFSLYFRNAYGVTDVDTYWFGHYSYRTDYAYTQISSDSSTYPAKYADNYDSAFESYINDDSGFAVSWQNINLEAGQSKTFSIIVGVGEAANAPKFDPDTPLSFDVSGYEANKSIKVTAKVTDTAGRVDSLYYDVDGTGENLLGSVTATGDETTIERDIDLSSFNNGVYIFHFWLLNDAGASSSVVQRKITIYRGSAYVGDDAPQIETYTVTFSGGEGAAGTAPTQAATAEGGTFVLPENTFTKEDHTFAGWSDGTHTYQAGATYTMPASNVIFTAQWEAESPKHVVKVEEAEGGRVSANRSYASYGSSVRLTVIPDEDYKLHTLTVVDSAGNKIPLTENEDGTYRFMMPARKVTVSAVFTPVHGDWEVCDGGEACPADRFLDLELSLWYHDGIHYCVENGLMQGVPGNLFAPDATTTRGMIVTILYRLENEPTISGECPFDDVNAGSWYEDAITWAAANKIVEGYLGKYHPEDAITREQMAVIFYRYAEYKGYDVADQAELSKFTDSDEISTWAEAALSWANANSLVEGDGNKLMPIGNAERCQVAAIIMRFCMNVAK